MGRAIKDHSKNAAKNRARVKKCRFLKKMRFVHESYVRDQVHSINELLFERNCSDSDSNIDDDKNDFGDINKSTELTNKLRFWAANHRITHSAINDLLGTLICCGLTFLPKSSRTFMKTPVNVEITTVTKGKLWYHGIQKCLESALFAILHNVSITLDFSVDGLPIFKSSNVQFWPMLTAIQGILFILLPYNILCEFFL